MPAKKSQKLIKSYGERVRTPAPQRLREAPAVSPKMKPVAYSLAPEEAQWVDQTYRALKQAGFMNANRSSVVREAILRLRESLKNKNSKEIIKDFMEHQSRRS